MNGRLMNRRKDEEIILKVLEIMEEAYYELQDKIVPDALLESLENAVGDIQRWRSMGDDSPKHTKEDLEYSERYAEGLEIVLKAWTVRGSEEERRVEELMSCIRKD
jgi:hypothetical protein